MGLECSVDDCGRPAHASGLCRKHYMRAYRQSGDVTHVKDVRGPHRDHPLYRTWNGMLKRCNPANATIYPRYAGRGITVCPEWVASFWRFVDDMGERPEGHSLDRIDNDKGYSADNCRWATWHQQQRNRADTRIRAPEIQRIGEMLDAGATTQEIAHVLAEDLNAVGYAVRGIRSGVLEDVGVVREKVPALVCAPSIEPPPTCSVEGCEREHAALGLCSRHYYRKRVADATGRSHAGRACKECGAAFDEFKPIRQKFCNQKCQQAWHRREGCYTPGHIKMMRPKCAVDGCNDAGIAQGLCGAHYAKQRAHGDPLFQRPAYVEKPCSEDGCETRAVARGFCLKHYKQKRNSGSLNVAGGRPRRR